VITSYVGGLGGRDISLEDFRGMAEETSRAAQNGHTPPPRLLYTAAELAQMRGLQAIAKAQNNSGGHTL
jgi:pyruvate ferredoxin oxidoreductase alpha subunit